MIARIICIFVMRLTNTHPSLYLHVLIHIDLHETDSEPVAVTVGMALRETNRSRASFSSETAQTAMCLGLHVVCQCCNSFIEISIAPLPIYSCQLADFDSEGSIFGW